MELNGVANIKMLVTEAFNQGKVDQGTMENIDYELDVLERYMIALAEGLNPFWHEVKANIKSFPNMKERMSK